MKKSVFQFFSLIIMGFMSLVVSGQGRAGQDSTGLPGDHFSLQGALQLFKQAASPEAFEKSLNEEASQVNNLDLDGDGQTDYIRVVNKTDQEIQLLVLQVAVSETESQDIAVIEIEKTGSDNALLQIVGDEDIYGEELIVEPDDEEGTSRNYYINSSTGGPAYDYLNASPVIVNVWLWPSVRFIYAPGYRPWVSPWRWRSYPSYWRPWRPVTWRVYHPRMVRYRPGFVIVPTHRIARARVIYRPIRVTSVTVRTRHAVSVNNYRVTRTKTTVTGPRGNSATRTKTTIRKKRGKRGRF